MALLHQRRLRSQDPDAGAGDCVSVHAVSSRASHRSRFHPAAGTPRGVFVAGAVVWNWCGWKGNSVDMKSSLQKSSGILTTSSGTFINHHRDTETQRDLAVFLCVSVSLWLRT